MDLKARVEDLNQLVLDGKMMEAFEKYYANDIVMQEINMDPVSGKDANREREKKWLSGITEFRGAEVKNVAVGDDVTMVEWFMDYSHKEYGDVKLDQVTVQTWKDGKIVKEIFYHG
jgi:SnoaL-like domain